MTSRSRAGSASASRRGPFAPALLALLGLAVLGPRAARAEDALPRYAHVFVIVEENKDFEQILAGPDAPNLQALARTFGQASQFFGEVHPSEGNYVALLGGDTFGIHDDDAFYCRPGMHDVYCAGALQPDYASHTVAAPHLGTQLERAGLSWKGYYEDLPAPGSSAVVAGEFRLADGIRPAPLYAAKHSGFMNFASVQLDPERARKIVGFDQLEADVRADRLPTFALIVPNQCNEMHGVGGPGVPEDCASENKSGLIRRGDAEVGRLVRLLQSSRAWKGADNVAILIGFDEGANRTREGCCGITPGAASNFGGGHIPMIVVTNHGPRGVDDPTPYSHYSLLRTLEDVFGIAERLGHAGDAAAGVRAMTPLFRTKGS